MKRKTKMVMAVGLILLSTAVAVVINEFREMLQRIG